MDSKLKKILRAVSLEIRRLLEGRYDEQGNWVAGDLERRLNELGVRRDRAAIPVDEMPHLAPVDKAARRLVDGYLKLRDEAGVPRAEAVAEFVRESAYTWANRLFALRCMEARGIIDEVILQKDAYGGRSLVHHRFAKKNPEACAGDDDGLFTVLFAEFEQRGQELPAGFDPKSPAVALRPSVAALKKTIALLSGREAARGQDAATDEVFAAPDAFGWAYQYWNADEKDRVFEMVRTKKGAKIQGADIIPATQLYTEPYMVKFLVQNSLGALWMGMYPDSQLCGQWEYFVKDADRAPVTRKPVREITFLDPAQGSGHFHLEAFDLFYAMYAEEAEREGRTLTPREICAAILNHNLYGIDIDGRSVQIATAALWMKAREKAGDLAAGDLNSFHEHLVATNIRLPKERNHLELFLKQHPEDEPLRPALELVFQGLEHADELGALLQIEELVDAVLRRLKEEADKKKGTAMQPGLFEKTLVQGTLPVSVEDYDKWKNDALNRLQAHFESEAQAADAVQAFFGDSAIKSLAFFGVLSRRYDVVAANPPYMGSNNMGPILRAYVKKHATGASRDLYGAFLFRGMSLCHEGAGVLAFVTLESWCFKKAFTKLREKVVTSRTIECIVYLGRHAFSDADPPGLPVMSLIRNSKSQDQHRIWTIRLTAPREAEEQALIVKQAASDRSTQVFRTEQINLTTIPNFGFFTWLPEELLLSLRNNQRVGDIAECLAGLQTGDTPRFVRFIWEIDLTSKRWLPFVQGGAITKWHGLERAAVDWRGNGILIRDHPGSCWRGTHYFEREGLTYSESARGKLAMRLMKGCGFSQSGSGVFPRAGVNLFGLAAILSSRLASYSSRFLRPGRAFPVGYLALIPVPSNVSGLEAKTKIAVKLKSALCQTDILELSFAGAKVSGHSLSQNLLESQLATFAATACLHSVEGLIENEAFRLFDFSTDTVNAVINETGKPVGWFDVLPTTGKLPLCPELESAELESVFNFAKQSNGTLQDFVVPRELEKKLRSLFGTGPGEVEEENEVGDEVVLVSEDEESEDDGETIAAVPIPPETFLEELSQKLEIHPLSTFWLLQKGMVGESWRCPPEERRLTGDNFTVLVLRLLGHRWPKQIEAAEPLPAWADQDGVIPLTSGGGETPLFERVRERLAADFPGGNVAALQQEFAEIVGEPLEQWLAGPFFERHISQFKKRPIAWQIETEVRSRNSEVSGKKKTAKGPKAAPVFSCLVYYHKLDEDLLPKIRTQYVGLLRGGFETEQRTLEKLANRTPEQESRRLQLDSWIEEMKAFDAKLEQLSARGFGPESLRPALRQFGIADALLSLTAWWLKKLNGVVEAGPLKEWQHAAGKTNLHADISTWVAEAFQRLDYFCAAVGPVVPEEKSFATDPTSKDLAPLVCATSAETVGKVLELACDRWRRKLDEVVLDPLKDELKQKKDEQDRIKDELKLDEVRKDFERQKKLADRLDELKRQIKALREEIDEKTDAAKRLRREIESWTCAEAATWEKWLGTQPLFDTVASLDGKRPPPATIAEFIVQESSYAPDINDGVRVNIAPLQKAGLLHADVLDAKDVDRAIADRAEWRADERRWVREGKLPQPGWWVLADGHHAHGHDADGK